MKIIFTTYQNKTCGFYVKDNRLLAVRVLSEESNRIGSIYIGKVKNMAKTIDACFVEIANRELCFLSLKDATSPLLLNRTYDGRLLEGDEILVQISKEAQKTKQASVTAHVSLSDRYVALGLGNPNTGYSSKLTKARKEEIRHWLEEEDIPRGLVVRTASAECSKETLLTSIRNLEEEFTKLTETAKHRTCFTCIRQAPEDFSAVLEQLAYPEEYEEIITDDKMLFSKLEAYCKEQLPDKPVRFYNDPMLSLSKLYSLEQKMDTALNARVWLKSGGYLVIEHTEALTVIDVNSGKYEAKKAQKTFEKINYEAAEEIALQLRLRNLSGIILIDFINMDSKEEEEQLLTHLKQQVNKDRIKTLVVDMTPLGLVEVTRKKTHKPLREQFLTK